MIKQSQFVDEQTGEIRGRKFERVPDALNEEGYRVPPHKRGAKLFSDIPFPAEMTDSEIGKMTRLSKLMLSATNMLAYRTRSGIVPYTESDIIAIVGLSERRGKEFIEKMIRLGVMQKNIRIYDNIEVTEFYINPVYFFAGKRIGLHLYLMFRESLDDFLPDWVKKAYWLAAKNQAKAKPVLSD